MKADKEHRVPLSDAALDLLQNAYREDGNPYLFIGTSQQRLSPRPWGGRWRGSRTASPCTVSKFSFSDWAHERTAIADHTIELCLAHTIGNAVEQAYRRGDMFEKRRKLMDAGPRSAPARQRSKRRAWCRCGRRWWKRHEQETDHRRT